MAINLTDSLNAATTKGKLGDAKQVYLNGDTKNLQQTYEETNTHFDTLDNRSTQMENAIRDISVTGGASTANAVSYNNSTSKLEAITAQGAIDELAAKKFDKESILQESGDAKDKVMSQKATTTAIEDETTRAKAAEEAIIFDVSVYNNGAIFESLQALLSSSNLSTLIPTSVRHGGMVIRFIQGSKQSSDNKYVQYRLMSNEWNINTEEWAFCSNNVYIENSEFLKVETDRNGIILWGIKTDNSFYFGAGCPPQIKKYVQEHASEILAALETKVDKIEGKSLIDSMYASLQKSEDNPEWLHITTDSEETILEGHKNDGKCTKVINTPIETPTSITSCIDNPEWMEVKTDKDGSILEGIRKNGTKYIANLEGYSKGEVKQDYSSNMMYPIKDDTIGHIDGSYYVIPNIGKTNRRRFKLKYKWAKNLCVQNDSNIILNIKGKSGDYTFTLNQTAPSNTKLFPQVINTDIQPGRENVYNVDYPMAAMDSSLVIKKNGATISTINLDNIRFRNLTKYNPAMSIQYIKKPNDVLSDLLDLKLYITSSGNNICDALTIKKGSTILFTYQFDITKRFYDTYMDLKTGIESIKGYDFSVVFYDIERMSVADIIPTKADGLPFVSAYSKNLLNSGEILYGAFPAFIETQDKSIHDLQIVEFDGHLNVYLDEGQLLRVIEDEVSEISIHRGIISIVSTGQDDTDSSYSVPTIYEITGHGFANRPFGERWDTQNLNQQIGYFTHLKKRFESNGYVNISMKEAARHYTDGYPVPDKCFFIDLDDFPFITDTYKGVPTKTFDWNNEDGMRLMEIWKSTGIKLTFTQEFSRDQELWERLTYGEATNEVKVADVQAMLSLTTSNVATGYIVKTLDNNKEYVVIDSSKLGTMDAFSEIDEDRLCALLTNDEIIRVRNMMKNYDWNVNIHSFLGSALVGGYKSPGNMNFDEWKSAIRTTIKWYERMYENVPMRHNMSSTGQNSPYFERLYACYGIPITGCDSPGGNGEVPHEISDYPTFNKLTFGVYRPQGILYNDYDFE